MVENKRLSKQKNDIEVMIKLYCKKKHGRKHGLCDECKELFNYAVMRIERCKFGDKKPNCGGCKIHCYKKEMRESIIEVMKFSGPRMLIYNPRIAIDHLIDMLKYK